MNNKQYGVGTVVSLVVVIVVTVIARRQLNKQLDKQAAANNDADVPYDEHETQQ